LITPRILKGFRDFLPQTMIQKKEIIKKLENIFESFGFVPIDTPALEYTEILLGKAGGETEKQIYRFKDHGDRDVSLRFDLTVPLARFVSLNFNELTFPFKAYHIAPVWRGENTQKGRFREFYQCDFDILGINSTQADLEILLVIKSGLSALGAGDFCINVNSRKILNALLQKFNLTEKNMDILRIIDKLYKIGIDNVSKELIDILKIDSKIVSKILDFICPDKSTNNKTGIKSDNIFNVLNKMKSELGNELAGDVNDLELIFKSLDELKILNYFSFNPAITRGLDYYTGIVFESFILDRLEFGSICSGGRYDNLTSLYSKNVIPGVGAAFGLDRIISLIEDKKLLKNRQSNIDLLIFNLDKNDFTKYQEIAEILRNKGISTEVFLEQKKLDAQFKFAEKKSIKYGLFAGAEEINNNKYNLKNLESKQEIKSLSLEEIINNINKK